MNFTDLVILSFKKEAMKKLIFSRPQKSDVTKVSCRLCSHRGRRILAIEFSLPGNTVSQKNIPEGEISEFITPLLSEYRQTNLLTSLGDAERKLSGNGQEVLLGADKLKRKLDSSPLDFERAIEELDKKKNYILSGKEEFLTVLGISDKNGRVHDKKQAKFRQINRFLEMIEDIYPSLPKEGEIKIFDLCSGKSYLSFAVYHYLTEIKNRSVSMLAIDLKKDVIAWCDGVARSLQYSGMKFICDDIKNTPSDTPPDMVISLHACDVATDIVIDTAIKLKAKVILSTPCCHRYMTGKIKRSDLSFVTDYSKLSDKLCEALTDALRLSKMKSFGYEAAALELTDPENTPKNTMLRAILDSSVSKAELEKRRKSYLDSLNFLFGRDADSYLKDILDN